MKGGGGGGLNIREGNLFKTDAGNLLVNDVIVILFHNTVSITRKFSWQVDLTITIFFSVKCRAAAGCGLRAAGCGLRAAGCGLRAAGCGRRDASGGTSCRVDVANWFACMFTKN